MLGLVVAVDMNREYLPCMCEKCVPPRCDMGTQTVDSMGEIYELPAQTMEEIYELEGTPVGAAVETHDVATQTEADLDPVSVALPSTPELSADGEDEDEEYDDDYIEVYTWDGQDVRLDHAEGFYGFW